MGKRFSKDALDRILSIITDEEERKVLLESDDPVLWAENHFYDPDGGEVPFKAKEMFYEFLRTGNKDRAGRIGRQAGKCESEFTRIQLADGSCPTAGEIYNAVGEDGEFDILSFDLDSFRHKLAKAIIEDNGEKSCVRVVTRSGHDTTNTDNHPYLVWRNSDEDPSWVEAKDLKPGMRVAVSRSLEMCSVETNTSKLSPLEAELLGYLVGDGGTSQHTIRFTTKDEDLVERINYILSTLNTGMHLVKVHGIYDYNFVNIDKDNARGASKCSWITTFVRKHGLANCLSKNKLIPPDIFRSSNESICSFLGAYWSTDGWACHLTSGNKTQLGCASASYELVRGIRTLLLRLGILSTLSKKKATCNGKEFAAWQLVISNTPCLLKFKDYISIPLKRKQAILNELHVKKTQSTTDTLPLGIWTRVKAILSAYNLKMSSLSSDKCSRVKSIYCPNRDTFVRQIHNLKTTFEGKELLDIASSDIFWDTITDVTNVGILKTYAISVDKTNILLTDNVITHNTVHTTLDIMHTAAFSNNAIINVFLPEKKNMNRMLEIMANLLGRSDLKTAFRMGAGDMKGGAKGDVKPSYDYEIQVASGSCIRFFFMSHKPDKARGQRATHMYIDEADYLPEKAFDVINGIVKGNLGIRVTAISTPSGMEDSWFRNFCNACSKNGTEFHISTKQEKNWLEIEKRLRELIFDDVTWNLEVLAEWADARGAVYKKDLIDNAINRSFIGSTRVTKEEIYETSEYKEGDKFLGVDWNVPQNGVRLVEITKMYDQYWVTRNHKIAYDEFTQTKSVEEILKLHDQFGYKYISVDLGYGEVQIELLLKALAERGEQQIKVLNIVDSQKKEEMVIETETPAGGRKRTIINVRTKTKIVGLVSKFIESSLVFFQEDDAAKDGIVKEVRNFRRKGTAMDGGFLYSENTHSLSALQIAVHGLDKWVRYGNLANRIVTEVKATASLNDTLKRGRQNINSIKSSPFYINRSTTGRTGGLSRG